MEYNFNGKITLEDYIQFNENIYKFPFSTKIKYIFCVFLLGIFIYIILPVLLELEPQEILKFFANPKVIINLILFFSIIILILVFPKILRSLMKNIYKKYYDSNKTMTELCHYFITENIIKINSESEDITLRKDKINKIKYDNDSIYIYIGLNMAYIIKKHFFENDKEFEALKIFIKENFDKR